jgi:2'-5' RNA ligase
MKRVFAAVVPGEPAVAELASHIDELRTAFPNVKANWVRPENLHLTLHFAGELDESRLEAFERQVSEAASITPRFQAALSGAGAFNDKKLGRSVLWIGIKELGEAAGVLADAVREIKARQKESSKSFVPHLTLARVRGVAPVDFLEAHAKRALAPVTFEVSEFVVMESTLTPAGSIYKARSRYALSQIRLR